jgi:hypothetical protein
MHAAIRYGAVDASGSVEGAANVNGIVALVSKLALNQGVSATARPTPIANPVATNSRVRPADEAPTPLNNKTRPAGLRAERLCGWPISRSAWLTVRDDNRESRSTRATTPQSRTRRDIT